MVVFFFDILVVDNYNHRLLYLLVFCVCNFFQINIEEAFAKLQRLQEQLLLAE